MTDAAPAASHAPAVDARGKQKLADRQRRQRDQATVAEVLARHDCAVFVYVPYAGLYQVGVAVLRKREVGE